MDRQHYPAEDNRLASSVDHTERAHRLRKALKDQPGRKLSVPDQRAVAEALYRLLQRLQEDHDLPKAKILLEAGIGDEGDSTKHLSQYAIRPGASPDRLRKKVGVYAELAKKAANLAGLDESEVLQEIFGQAAFWQTTGTRQARAEFIEMAERLHFVMDAVAREQGLTEFFQSVEKGGGILTPHADCWGREQETGQLLTPQEIAIEFDFSPGWGSQRWPIEFYQPTKEAEDGNGDHVPAYPSLILGAWRLESPFPVKVAAEMTDASVQAASGIVDGQYEIEMRLCIVPTGKAMEATPALRVQLNTTLSPLMAFPSAEATPILTFPWVNMPVLKRGRSKVVGQSASGNQDVVCEVNVTDDMMPQLFKDYFVDLASSPSGQPDNSTGPRFLPITATVCEDWFGFAPSQNHYDPMQQRLADRAQGKPIADLSLTDGFPAAEFRSDTLADTIHRCLCDGSDGLDIRFKDHAELLRDTYAAARRLGLRQRQEGWERVKKRWAPSPCASDK